MSGLGSCTVQPRVATPSGRTVRQRRDSNQKSKAVISACHGPWQPCMASKAACWSAGALAAAAVLSVSPAHAAEFINGGQALFDPMRYIGRWYEVASEKKGFAGQGQGDCHCTQGIYVPLPTKEDPQRPISLEVNTFCAHGGPTGRLSGIQGRVSCADPALLQLLPEFETTLERQEGILEKCTLRFPSIPFIPPEPYDILQTDYDNYALVQGAADRSFVQVYSRTPNPGADFIAARKGQLKALGYEISDIKDTPQDCDEFPVPVLMTMMGKRLGGEAMPADTPPAEAMRGIDLGPVDGVKFEGNPLKAAQDLFKLFTGRA